MSDNKMPDEIWINKLFDDKFRVDEGVESVVGDEIESREYIAKDLVNLKTESIPISKIEALIKESDNRLLTCDKVAGYDWLRENLKELLEEDKLDE